MAPKKGGKAARARTRGYEKREAEFWAFHNWTVDLAWNECRGFIRAAGRVIPIIKRRDFFGKFDLLAINGVDMVVGVQVTESPFVQVRSGKADSNAAHGAAPFAWDAEGIEGVGTPDRLAVEGDREGSGFSPGFYQVIVSYADARKPERRWWKS